ncbi:hypothetical protein T484DRAFT_1811649 [Baffinella frigidus]|nr:hypothetical protein T484DRAFT_1811649 [Cryptophyta sp. CCMP2293]
MRDAAEQASEIAAETKAEIGLATDREEVFRHDLATARENESLLEASRVALQTQADGLKAELTEAKAVASAKEAEKQGLQEQLQTLQREAEVSLPRDFE